MILSWSEKEKKTDEAWLLRGVVFFLSMSKHFGTMTIIHNLSVYATFSILRFPLLKTLF